MDKLTYLPIEQLHPHPQNPRKELGDLTELADSIKASGIFQNLTVVPGHWMTQEEWADISARYKEHPTEELRQLMNSRWLETEYTVIIGHRRRAAAKLAGVTQLPCAIVEMTAQEQLQTMLLENMQRSDLTVYEQAQGFQLMIEMGDTPESIAEKTGFSKKTVKRRLEMARLDQRILKEVSQRQLSLADFDKLSQLDSVEERNACLQFIGTGNFNQTIQRQLKKQEIGKMLPGVLSLLKASKALKLKYSETWGGKYKQIGNTYDLPDWGAIQIPAPQKGRLYYCLEEDNGRLRFYEENKKTPVKRPQAEIDREKAMVQANEQLSRLSAELWQLRQSFVETLRLTARNKDEMFTGALEGCFMGAVLYNYGSADDLYKAAGMKREYNDECRLALYRQIVSHGDELIPKLIYHAYGDTNHEKYHTEYKGQFPVHKKSLRLDMVYTWLCSLGYEMSDEEKQLRDGTHPLLHLGEEKPQ